MKRFKDFRNEIQESMLDSVRDKMGSKIRSIGDGVKNRIAAFRERRNLNQNTSEIKNQTDMGMPKEEEQFNSTKRPVKDQDIEDIRRRKRDSVPEAGVPQAGKNVQRP